MKRRFYLRLQQCGSIDFVFHLALALATAAISLNDCAVFVLHGRDNT
jgi:hypothetical protein